MPDVASVRWPPFGPSPWTRPTCPPTVALPTDADTLIVGAGVTGLSAALSLLEAGRSVVVIDRRFGDGAACRSGGIVLGDTLVGPAEGFDGCEDDLRRWIEAHDVRGGSDWQGCLELDRDATRPRHPIDWRDDGVVRVGARVTGGTIDPAGLVEGLAREAHARGASVVDGADVVSLTPRGATIVVDTTVGSIAAGTVVMATDACSHVTDADPWPVRAITVAIETTPTTVDAVQRSGWPDWLPFYTNDLPLLWGRRLPSGGLLIGRELLHGRPRDVSDLTRAIHAAGMRLGARLRGLHPAFVDLDVARVWAGPIARTEAGVPSIWIDPRHPAIVWAGGYGGHGLAQAFRLGRRTADAIVRERR